MVSSHFSSQAGSLMSSTLRVGLKRAVKVSLLSVRASTWVLKVRLFLLARRSASVAQSNNELLVLVS